MTATITPGVATPETGEPDGPNQNTQNVLMLQAPRQRYELISGYPIPLLRDDTEILVRTAVIGLNPIDWKGPYVFLTFRQKVAR